MRRLHTLTWLFKQQYDGNADIRRFLRNKGELRIQMFLD
jgi:hypothetical protein